jgi:signal transduction histidine kinase
LDRPLVAKTGVHLVTNPGTMQINLKLSQMGLILLGIPALFEILFVLAIFVLLHQAEEEIQLESHSREVTAHAHNLQERITSAAISIGAYGYSKSPLARDSYEAAVDSMRNELATLRRLVQGDAPQLNRLVIIDNTVASALKEIADARAAIEKTSSLALLSGDTTISDDLDKLSGHVGKLQKQVDDMVTAEQKAHKDLPARRIQSRRQVMTALVAGALLNIALAIALASFFSRTVARRHLVLVDNTQRLAKAQALHPRLEGNDEIAQLDAVFHSMVHELETAGEFKKQLIGMVSHELRAPLTSIDAILTFLEAGGVGELPGAATKRLQTAQKEVHRLIALINDLLDVERMEAGKFEMSFSSIELGSVLQRAAAGVEGALQKKVLVLQVPATQALVWADEERLIQVLVNLLSNAIKFSPDRAAITISLEDKQDTVEVRVKDEGRGIPAHFKEKIFERFSQVEKSDAQVRGGSGLGLTICRAIILQHGGSIGVESEEGKGATFWFRIPRNAPAPALDS